MSRRALPEPKDGRLESQISCRMCRPCRGVQEGLPKFSSIGADAVVPAIQQLGEDFKNKFQDLEKAWAEKKVREGGDEDPRYHGIRLGTVCSCVLT